MEILSLLIMLPIIVGATFFAGFFWGQVRADREADAKIDRFFEIALNENARFLQERDHWKDQYFKLYKVQFNNFVDDLAEAWSKESKTQTQLDDTESPQGG